MTLLAACGCELQKLDEFVTSSGPPAIDTSVYAPGGSAASLKIPDDATSYADMPMGYDDAGSQVATRTGDIGIWFNYRMSELPSTGDTILQLWDGSASMNLRQFVGGKLRILDSANATMGTTTKQLEAGTWYTIGIGVTATHVKLWIDGSLEIDSDGTFDQGVVVRFGSEADLQHADYNFDDIVITDDGTTKLSFTGWTIPPPLLPNADHTKVDITPSSDYYAAMNEGPPHDGDTTQVTANLDGALCEVLCEQCDAGGKEIEAVLPFLWMEMPGLESYIWRGYVARAPSSYDFWDTHELLGALDRDVFQRAYALDPFTSLPWTVADLASTRVAFTIGKDTTADYGVTQCGFQVVLRPPLVDPRAVYPPPQTWRADNSTQGRVMSMQQGRRRPRRRGQRR